MALTGPIERVLFKISHLKNGISEYRLGRERVDQVETRVSDEKVADSRIDNGAVSDRLGRSS